MGRLLEVGDGAVANDVPLPDKRGPEDDYGEGECLAFGESLKRVGSGMPADAKRSAQDGIACSFCLFGRDGLLIVTE